MLRRNALLLAALLLALAYLVHHGSIALPARLSPDTKKAPSVASPADQALLEVEARATPEDIVGRCGKPAKITRTSNGSGRFRCERVSMWYPHVPVELEVVRYPSHEELRMRAWTFAGGFLSDAADDDRVYSGEELRMKMPCAGQWAHAWAEVERQTKAVPQPR